MERTYIVLTGIRRFEVTATSPEHAIEVLKEKIRARANVRKNPEIGMSLVEALAAGTLNFLVIDADGIPVGGEFEGRLQFPPSAELVLAFPTTIKLHVLYSARSQQALQQEDPWE